MTQQNQNAQNTEGIQQNQALHKEQDIEQGQDNEQHRDVEEYQHDLRESDDWEDVTGSSISEAGSPEVKPTTGSLSTTSIDELGHTEYRLQETSSEQAPNEDQAHEESRYMEDLSHEEVASRDGDSSWRNESSQVDGTETICPIVPVETGVVPCAVGIVTAPGLGNTDIQVHHVQMPRAFILPPAFLPPPGLENADRQANPIALQVVGDEMRSSQQFSRQPPSQSQPQWRAIREPVPPPCNGTNGVPSENYEKMQTLQDNVSQSSLSPDAITSSSDSSDPSADSTSSSSTVTPSSHQSVAPENPRPGPNVRQIDPQRRSQDLMYDSTPDVDDIPSTNRRQYGRRVRLERRSALQDLLEDSIPDVPDEHIDHVRGNDGQFTNSHQPRAAQWNNGRLNSGFVAPRLKQPPLAARGRFAHLFRPQ